VPLKNKIKIKYVIIALLVLGVCISAIYYVRNNINPEVIKDYKRFTFSSFQPARQNTIDFTVKNEIELPKLAENFVYKASALPINNITNSTLKLGLSNESVNDVSQVYSWRRGDMNSPDLIVLKAQRSRLEIRYPSGLNNEKLNADQTFKYINDFFGLNNFEPSFIGEANFDEGGARKVATFKYKFNNETVNFEQASDVAATIITEKGKIIEAYIFLIPQNFEKSYEVKPVEKINATQLSGLYYFVNIKPSVTVNSGVLGGEGGYFSPVTINMKETTHTYYYYYDTTAGTAYLLPAFLISGNYIDQKNNLGEFVMIVINQSN
jgi:hypothetical protein